MFLFFGFLLSRTSCDCFSAATNFSENVQKMSKRQKNPPREPSGLSRRRRANPHLEPDRARRFHRGPTAGLPCGGRGRKFDSCRAHGSGGTKLQVDTALPVRATIEPSTNLFASSQEKGSGCASSRTRRRVEPRFGRGASAGSNSGTTSTTTGAVPGLRCSCDPSHNPADYEKPCAPVPGKRLPPASGNGV